MKLEELEEKKFIKNILGKYAKTAKAKDFDDCIVIDLSDFTKDPEAPYLVYSIDHPSYIKRNDMTQEDNLEFYGRWATACTCGDVIAMGAKVMGFSLDLSAPLSTDVNDIEYIMKGISETLNSYGASFEGGNFDANSLETVCMAWGIVDKDKIIRRSGAQKGDLILATGNLGIGWSGVIANKKGIIKSLPKYLQEDIAKYKNIPVAPYTAMQEIFSLGLVTSGMDLSDGIVEFYYNILYKNNLGVEVDYNILPEHEQTSIIGERLGIDGKLFAFEPGYDTPITHAWTIKPKDLEIVSKIFEENKIDFNIYGVVSEEERIFIKNGDEKKIIPEFWDDQFRKESTVDRWYEIINKISFKKP